MIHHNFKIFFLNRIKSIFYLSYNNSNYFRKKNFFLLKDKALKLEKYNFDFFNMHYTNSKALGPLQKDEAIFLFSLVKCISPKVVLELGFHKGHSALSILQALDANAIFKSVDIDINCKKIFDFSFKKRFPNSELIIENMIYVDYDKIFGDSKVDFVLFDAVHDLELNIEAYFKLKDRLSENALIVIHDTGIWNRKNMNDLHFNALQRIKSKLIDQNYAHQIDERRFSNYLIESQNYKAFHVHSENVLRHGLTILHNQNQVLKVT